MALLTLLSLFSVGASMNSSHFVKRSKKAMRRWVGSYRQRIFVGFASAADRPFGQRARWPFRSYYFAHLFSVRDFLRGFKQPHGACLSALDYLRASDARRNES